MKEISVNDTKKLRGKLRQVPLVNVAREMAEPRVAASARAPLLKQPAGRTKDRPKPPQVSRSKIRTNQKSHAL